MEFGPLFSVPTKKNSKKKKIFFSSTTNYSLKALGPKKIKKRTHFNKGTTRKAAMITCSVRILESKLRKVMENSKRYGREIVWIRAYSWGCEAEDPTPRCLLGYQK